jgi:hypothetical protein
MCSKLQDGSLRASVVVVVVAAAWRVACADSGRVKHSQLHQQWLTWVRTVPIGVVAATATTTTTAAAATSPSFPSAKHASSLFIAEKVRVGPVDVAQHHRLLGRKKSHPGSSSPF